MNFLDIIIFIPLIWGAFRGFKNGLVIEIASLAGLILGIYAAIHFSGYAAGFLSDNFNIGDTYLNIFAFILTFIVVVLVVYLIGKILEKLIDIIMLGFLNRIAGLLFGFLKWAFILSILIYVIHIFDEDDSFLIKEEWRQESLLYEPVKTVAPYILPRLNLEKLDDFINPQEEEELV